MSASGEKPNGKWKLVIGLLCLTLAVAVGTYFDVTRRLAVVSTLEQLEPAIRAQTADINELQSGGTQVSREILRDLGALRGVMAQRWAGEDAVRQVEHLKRIIDERCPPPEQGRKGR